MLQRPLPALPLLVDLLSLLIVSTAISPAFGAAQSPSLNGRPVTHVAQAGSNDAISTYAHEMTVRVSTSSNQGSGTLLAQQNKTCLVLTNAHILQGAQSIQIQTHDGQIHPATLVENAFAADYDLALVKFVSNQPYPLPEIGNFTPRVGQQIMSAGYAADAKKFQISGNQLQQILDQPLKGGYQLGYQGDVAQGMSGGPVIEAKTGELIGINGRSAFSVLDDYETVDGTSPSPKTIKQLRHDNWGIPLQTVLAQIQPDILTTYGLPQPLVASTVKTAKAQGWVADLEAKAKQFSVRINSSSGSNGSGVIIAKQGRTYTVLTANHVVCETANGTPPCPAQSYAVVTPDGQTLPINPNTIQRQEGVDLAIFKFQSDTEYDIATFGNYSPREDDEVFVAGFSKVTPAQAEWQFNGGKVFEKSQGTLQVTSYSLRQNNTAYALPQASFSGGYELVYTSITYGGMSGGMVLDRQGQVIGIHGLAEGESQTGNLKIQLGLSLGIPTSTILGSMSKFQMTVDTLQISSTAPAALSATQQEDWKTSVLQARVSTSNAKAEVWIERGNQLWRLERYAEALAAFDRAIQQNPPFVHLAWYGKALVFRAQKNYAEAEVALQTVVKLKPNYKSGWQELSVIYRNLNQPEQALRTIKQAIQIEPDDAQLFNEKYAVLSELKRYPDALAAINQAITLAPRSAFYSNRGRAFIQLQRYDDAIVQLNQAIELDPNLVIAYTNRGVANLLTSRTAAAIADYTKAIEIDPQYSHAYAGLGLVYRDLKRYEDALGQVTKAIDVDPEIANNYAARGLVYLDLQRYDEAIANQTKAIELGPNIANGFFSRGNVYMAMQHYANAITDYTKAIEIDPQNPSYLNSRGDAYAALNQSEAALADYSHAIELDSKGVRSYVSRGNMFHKTQQHQRAIADFDKAIEVADSPQTFEIDKQYKGLAYTARGFLYNELGKIEQAIADFSKAIELSPNTACLYRARALNYSTLKRYELKRYEKALADYTKAIAVDPQDLSTYISRGELFQKLGRETEAHSDFLTVLKTKPTDSEGYGVRAGVYKSLKRYPEAIADYAKAIELDPQNGLKTSILYSSRAKIYSILKQYEEARADYSQAIALQPNPRSPFTADLYTARGNNFLSWKRLEAALADLDQAIEINPKNTTAYAGRGPIYLETKHYEEALSDFNKIIELNPELAPAYDLRSQAFRALNRFEEAISDASKFIELQPNQSDSYTHRGILYLLTNDASQALKDFQQAITLDQKALIPTVNMGLIYYEQGDQDLAITQFKRGIDIGDPTGEVKLALAVALYHNQQRNQAIELAQSALKQNPKLRQVEVLKGNLWGETLIADTQKLLADPALQTP